MTSHVTEQERVTPVPCMVGMQSTDVLHIFRQTKCLGGGCGSPPTPYGYPLYILLYIDIYMVSTNPLLSIAMA